MRGAKDRSDFTLDRTRHWLAGASSCMESAKSWRSPRVTVGKGLLTNEQKRDASLPYARNVLGLRPCSHSLSICSSLLACWFAATAIPSPPTVLDECRIMALLMHSDYRNQEEVTRIRCVIIRYKSS